MKLISSKFFFRETMFSVKSSISKKSNIECLVNIDFQEINIKLKALIANSLFTVYIYIQVIKQNERYVNDQIDYSDRFNTEFKCNTFDS